MPLVTVATETRQLLKLRSLGALITLSVGCCVWVFVSLFADILGGGGPGAVNCVVGIDAHSSPLFWCTSSGVAGANQGCAQFRTGDGALLRLLPEAAACGTVAVLYMDSELIRLANGLDLNFAL